MFGKWYLVFEATTTAIDEIATAPGKLGKVLTAEGVLGNVDDDRNPGCLYRLFTRFVSLGLFDRASKRLDLTLDENDGRFGARFVFHRIGPISGFIVGLFDFAKGVITIAVAHALDVPTLTVLLAGGAAVIGHNWSTFAGSKVVGVPWQVMAF